MADKVSLVTDLPSSEGKEVSTVTEAYSNTIKNNDVKPLAFAFYDCRGYTASIDVFNSLKRTLTVGVNKERRGMCVSGSL